MVAPQHPHDAQGAPDLQRRITQRKDQPTLAKRLRNAA